jgi:light-regulated signal transduction histidine kinase (bacteriophytochrome)
MELAISPEQIVRRPANCLLIRRDGYEIPIHDVVSPIHDRDGRATGSVIVFRDVSEPRAMELWMQRAKTELERSNRELQEFASVASHDLQEPLRKIRAFGDRLAQRTEGALDDDSRADLERIQGAAARMQALIDDLLEYALVTTRARAFRPVDLGAVAAEVVEDLVERLERTGGRVEVGPLPIIEADPTQMRQLLQNLLGNGLKFQREGVPPLVRLSAGPAAGIVGRGESVALTVSDNGIGFEARHAERIFAPFERLHGRTAYEGTGIGLAICHKIVERHAGDIVASGRPGEGATFTVILPLRQATPAGQALAA